MEARRMNWKSLTAFVLFLPVWWWIGLPPPSGLVEMAEHYAEMGDHSEDHCSHPIPLVRKPYQSTIIDATLDEPVHLGSLLAVLSPDHFSRDRPPPLFLSLSHSLRAPPTLIPRNVLLRPLTITLVV